MKSLTHNIKTQFRPPMAAKSIVTIGGVSIHQEKSGNFNGTACVCILLKNIEPYVSSIYENINFLKTIMKGVFFVLIDNNSTDKTAQLCKSIPNSILLQAAGQEEYAVRNMYLKFVHDNKSVFTYMMVIDAEICLRSPLRIESFNFLEKDTVLQWDVIFANQSYKYYDIYNLITDQFDITQIDRTILQEVVSRQQKHIPMDSGFIPVKSAFGGFAIYKTHILVTNNKYTTDGHVSFNLKLREVNPSVRMFIDSSFIIETHTENAHLYVS